MTGLLTTCGQEFFDWTADYRLFSQHRLPLDAIFSVIRRHTLQRLPPQAPLCVAMDDTLLRKSGPRIPGVAWRRDPLGPHFHTNFVRGQRFLQLSADIPLPNHAHRMVPISFSHAPTPLKPSSKASAEDRAAYLQAARSTRLSLRASQQISSLRQSLDTDPTGLARPLQVFADGGYTNSTVLKSLPANTVFVGRVRKDARLFYLPPAVQTPAPGRPRRYGAPAPTPEQVRTDDSIPWQKIPISINGTTHQMRVKICHDLLWRTAGLNLTLQLMVVAPLGYRLRKGSKVLYRQPAFLICTDSQMDPQPLLQGYVHRSDIEVNFREEKTLLGVGQAQVRNPESVESLPALQVASYAMLLLSMSVADSEPLPPPKWLHHPQHRPTTQRAINQLRGQTWARALGLTSFSDFVTCVPPASSTEKLLPHLPSALLYAAN